MKVFLALFQKDFQCLFRSRALVVSVFGFALLLVIVASFAFRQIGYAQTDLRTLTPGILWLVFLFTAVTGLNQAFVSEEENQALRGILLTGVSPTVIFFSKCLSLLVFLFLVQSFVIGAHNIFFGVDAFFVFDEMLLLTFLVSLGFVSLGTLLSAISVTSRGREILLPLLLFPLALPLLAGAVFLGRQVLETGEMPTASFWFVFVLAYDVITLTLCSVLFEFVVRE